MTDYNKERNHNYGHTLTPLAKSIIIEALLKDHLDYLAIEALLAKAQLPQHEELYALRPFERTSTLQDCGLNVRATGILLSLSMNTIYMYNKATKEPKPVTPKPTPTTTQPNNEVLPIVPSQSHVVESEEDEVAKFMAELAARKAAQGME